MLQAYTAELPIFMENITPYIIRITNLIYTLDIYDLILYYESTKRIILEIGFYFLPFL